MSNNFTPIDDLIKKIKNSNFVGSSLKEVEPITKSEQPTIKEVVEEEVKSEVQPYLKKRAETIKLPPDLKKLGIQSISTPQVANYQNIKLPISDEKIIAGLRAPINSSLRWLATLAVYLLKMAHLQLKIVHGKITRVLIKN